MALTACGASVPSTHVGAPGQGQKPAANAAPVKPISMDDVTRSMSGDQSVRVHLKASIGAKASSTPMIDVTFTSDAGHDRFSMSSAPTEVAPGDLPEGTTSSEGTLGLPGFELRGQTSAKQVDLYYRMDGEKSWTHLVIDPSLGDEVAKLHDLSPSFGDNLTPGTSSDFPGFTFENKGTVTYAGETMTRQVATLDFAKMLGDLAPPSTTAGDPSDPTGSFQGALGDALSSGAIGDLLPKGTVEVLVDQNQVPRRVTQDLTMGSGSDAISMHLQATIDPLGKGDTVDLPSADQVGRTVQVHTADELAKALGDLGPLASGGIGGN